MRRVGIFTGYVVIGLLLSCGEPASPVTPPAPIASASAAPPVDPAPSASAEASAAPSAAPAAPPVARKECSKVVAMAPADDPFWHVLAQPGACWSLLPTGGDPLRDIVIEAYDARSVDGADVARLRVTYNGPNGPEDISDRDPWPQQVAVGPKGVWFVGRKADDKAVTAAMAKAPTYLLVPRPMEPAKANKWRFLRKGASIKGEVACVGFEIPKPECTDACSASICASHTGGIVLAEGAATPTGAAFTQRGVVVELMKAGAPDPKASAPKKP